MPQYLFPPSSFFFLLFFFSLSAEDWSLEKSFSSGDRRESRSSSYLCHHSYWSEPRRKWANNSKRCQARADERKVIKSPDASFEFKRHRWLGAVPETPVGRNLETVRDFCDISVDALLSVGIGVRFCSVYYTDSVTRINQNCLKKNNNLIKYVFSCDL